MKSLLVLGVVNALVALVLSGAAEQKSKNCNEVRAAYSSKGFNVNDVPNKGVNGEFCVCVSGGETTNLGNFLTPERCLPDPPPAAKVPKVGVAAPRGVRGEESRGSRGSSSSSFSA